MLRFVLLTSFLIPLSLSGALAQSGGASSSSAKGSQMSRDSMTPVGHRQPRAMDLPAADGKTESAKLSPEDAALDRKLKSICRGC